MRTERTFEFLCLSEGRKANYEAPAIKVIEFAAERGFAMSSGETPTIKEEDAYDVWEE
ncbi:MAG: hypothetical protein LUC96_12700 [Alistipes sp.]|uniref:hypothetical protein n=1 Tax=Alistipes sp. TaxID=1872444 RepID=UPI0025C61678|nr:hypothetical protein [Alistipes sp.]MCD7795844.1 hypothetical protein [Alistipes sp.]MCD8275813.1 hypothetical protein [Alistipes sp.]